MAYQFKMLKKGDTPIFSRGGYGFFRLSSEVLPTPTTSLVYTLSSDSSYYIVGTGFTSIEDIDNDSSGGTAGSGLDSTWSGGALVIPDTYNGLPVKAIAPKAFAQITNITSLYIYDGITTIGHRCFQCLEADGFDTAMTSCRLPNTFEYYSGLGGNSSNQGRVFWGRQGLTSIEITAPISGYYTFSRCTALKTATMPNMEYFRDDVFSYCTSLETVTVPSSCVSLGTFAFRRAGSSTSPITFIMEREVPPSLGSYAFYLAYINKIIVPKGCLEAYQTATNWSAYASYMEEAAE